MKLRSQFSVSFEYEVLFTRNVFALDNNLFLSHFEQLVDVKLAFVIDENVVRHHPFLEKQIEQYCEKFQLNMPLPPLRVPGGETCKNDLIYVQQVLDHIDKSKIDRHSYLIAIGGGALLDMAGFAATIAHRGVRHIRIPTTVLAQNDSGVGVKNSFNYFNKKNFLGTFSPPQLVINDAEFLTTLDKRDWRSGISEALKVALLKSPEFFHWIEQNTDRLNQRDLTTMEELVSRCAEFHMEHIANNGDPFELGSSRPLDFGHWSAHKLEQLTNFEVRHGEAVAIGLALDVSYSAQMRLIDKETALRVIDSIAKLGFAITHPKILNSHGTGLNPEIASGLKEFQEHLGGELTIMLLTEIGKGTEVHDMNEEKLDLAIQFLIEYTSTHAHKAS